MSKQELLQAIKLASLIWRDFSITDELIACWKILFSNVKYEDLIRSLQFLAQNKENSFAPSVPEIFSAIRKLNFTEEDFETAELAWVKNKHQETETGKQAWEQIGGDRRWGMCQDSELPFLRKEFIEIYNALKNRSAHVIKLKQLNKGEELKKIA